MPSRLGQMTQRFVTRSGLCAALVIAVLGFGTVAAQGEDSIAQSFQADRELAPGTLVSMQSGSPRAVEASNANRVSQLTGIVAENPLIEFSDGEPAVRVVTSGVTHALVSDINGTVSAGDKITASPIDGVGMKVSEPMVIVGTAQADLDSVQTAEQTLDDREGKTHTVRIGLVPVHVNVTFYAATAVQQDFVPPFLQDIANAIAGKPVSPVRVIASLLVMILAIISVSVLLYSSVRSSIISIGRNPLSEGAIHRSLIEVGITIIGVLLLTFITIYLILVT